MKRLVVLLMFLCSVAYAAPSNSVITPNSFSPLTTIQSSQVNDNFNEVSTKYNSHSHTDITQVSTLTSGVWAGTPVATQYGGTGNDFSGVAQGSIIYFNGVGSTTVLAPGSVGQILSTNGAGANPSWTSNAISDVILRGSELDYAGVNAVVASAGVVCVGTTVVSSATANTLTLATATDWASGSVVSYAAGAGWCYVGIKSNGETKLLGKTAPNVCDTSGNLQGTKYYLQQSGAYWRVIGSFRIATTDTVASSWYQSGNEIYYDDPMTNNQVVTAGNANTFTDVDCSAYIPKISNLGIFNGVNAGALNDGRMRKHGSKAVAGIALTGNAADSGYINCPTDNSQHVDYLVGGGAINISVVGYKLNIR